MNFKRLALSACSIILVSVLFVYHGFAAVYYIKNDGNDRASGLSDTEAWRTIAKINNFAENPGFSNGDIIQFNRGDTWSNDETLGHDGSVINWQGVNGITFQDYGTGAKPRLNANTQQPIWIMTNSISNVTIKNLDCSGMDYSGSGRSHIELWYFSGLTIDGVEINGHTGASSYNYHFAFIRPYNIDGNVTITNCVLQNNVMDTWENTVNGWGAVDANLVNMKYFEKPNTAKTTGTVTISNNIFHDVYADCILLNGIRTTSTSSIHSNTMYNFGENAIDLKSVKNCDIYGNQLSRGGYGKGGSGGGKSNIVTHSSAPTSVGLDVEDITIRDNEFYDSEFYGIRLISTTINTQIYGNTFRSVSTPIYVSTSPGTKIHDNVILGYTNYNAEGINRTAIAVLGTNQNDVEIYDNSIYLNSTNYSYGIYYSPREGRTGIEITNNIIQITQNSTSAFPLMVEKRAGDYPKVTDNCFYNSNNKNRISWKGTIYDTTNLIAWREINNSEGISGNPLFQDPENGNLQLKDNSPCSQWGADHSPFSKTKSRISRPKNFVIIPKG